MNRRTEDGTPHDNLIAQFVNICNSTPQQAAFYLKQAKTLEAAVELYFGDIHNTADDIPKEDYSQDYSEVVMLFPIDVEALMM